jgi:hypothetical protein
MPRTSILVLFIVTALAFPLLNLKLQASSVLANENVMEIQDALFAFGWSGIAGERWLVNGEIILLNSKALVAPPSTPINGDAGPTQANQYKIYLNGVGFYYGWSTNVSERYRPSTSMIVGAAQAFNNKGPIDPPNAPISGDAGSIQENPSLIYLNNIGFCFGWSANSSDRYRPSPTMEVGPLTPFNNKALVVPPSWAIGIDNTPPVTSDNYDGAWHNADFTITLTATDGESGVAQTYYRINYGPIQNVSTNGQPLITSEGRNNTLEYWSVDNSNNTELPHKFLFGIKLDKTSPVIWTQTRTPSGNVTANQAVTISANVTDSISGVKSARLEYNVSNSPLLWDFPMNLNSTTGLYEYTIPGQPAGALVKYKITAYDYAGNNKVDDNAGQYYVYIVVPEFPPFLILPLFMIATLLAVIVFKRKKGKVLGCE